MRSHPLVRAACASVLAAGLSLAASAVAQGEMVDYAESMPKQVGVIDDTGGLPHVKQENGISYISGGAGSDEADALNSMSGQFNLKLTMTVPSGQYTTPRKLRLEDAHGKPMLEIEPSGPIFLAKMPAGEYVVQATAEGQTLTRKVTVPPSGLEAVALTWPAKDEPVRAGDAPRPPIRAGDAPDAPVRPLQ
jgi:hypothetical protein